MSINAVNQLRSRKSISLKGRAEETSFARVGVSRQDQTRSRKCQLLYLTSDFLSNEEALIGDRSGYATKLLCAYSCTASEAN